MTHTTEAFLKSLSRGAVIVLGAATLGAGVALAEDEKSQADDPSTPIATVNGVSYPLDVFLTFYSQGLQGNQDTPEMQTRAFNLFLNLIVASQQAEKENMESRRDVQAALELSRMTVLSSATMKKFAMESQPSEEELKKAYEQFVEQSQRTEFKARHILLDEEDKAKDVIKKLKKKKGKNFEELAEEYSLGPTAEQGGDLGWFDSQQMVKPFADAVAEMEVGNFSTEPVKTQFGWHVILLEETRDAEVPPFDEVKPRLEAEVKRQMVLDKLNELRVAAKVDINEDFEKAKENGETAADDEDN